MHTPIQVSPVFDGTQRIYRFPNGYGASVISHRYARGGRELAVVTFPGEGVADFDLTYETPITNDVIGYLGEEEVEELLYRIEALPAPGS